MALVVIASGGLGVVTAATGVSLWPAALVLGVGLFAVLRRPLRRWRVSSQPLPADIRRWIEGHVPMYRRLSPPDRDRFDRDVLFVLDEWTFEGVRGVEVNDELRASVAAGVAVLLHGRPDWELSDRHTVLFYPERFNDDYLTGDRGDFDGMAHAQGPVIISVEASRRDWQHSDSGHNVVLHELAHLLDFKDSFADGVPDLLEGASRPAWDDLVDREMRRIRQGHSILRRYGATNRAEFFAVAVENFFERPDVMASRHPELFAALTAFFGYDPRLETAEKVGEQSNPH
ncbi:MAG: M90 family metallopeptidase [Rhodothermales bacterium]